MNTQLKKTLTRILYSSFCICPSAGCSQVNEQNAAIMANLAQAIGADVKVRGSLGPARFGPSFQADLGARIDIEAETDTGAVSAKDLLDLNKQILEMVKSVVQGSKSESAPAQSSQVIDETIEDLVNVNSGP